MKLCDTCIYRNNVEQLKPCIIYRDDCEYYVKEEKGMTREEAIQTLITMDSGYNPNFVMNGHIAIDMSIKALRQESKWITISERLPEDRNTVLVTAYWHETYQVMQAVYFGNDEWWCVPFNNCGEHMQRLKPKAWMPLPEPYEPQESEKVNCKSTKCDNCMNHNYCDFES